MTRFYGWAAAAAIFLLLGMGLAGWRADQTEWRRWQRRFDATHPDQATDIGLRSLTPTLTGQPELCTTCHVGLAEISSSHPMEAFGCVICHGGNGLALDRDRAHAGLLGGRNPSDFSIVAQTCGQSDCHSGYEPDHVDQNQVDRVLRSLQATYAGGIALVRFTFGAQPDQTARYGAVAAIDPDPPAGWVPALEPLPVSTTDDLAPELAAQGVTVSNHSIDTQFRQSCLAGGCHLSEPATPEPYRYRSTGCAACHYIYENDGLYQGDDPTIPRDEAGHGRRHQLTTAIPFYQCNHCHNRGNYSLRSMSFTLRPDLPPAGETLSFRE